MSDLIFNIPSAFLTLGPVLARGANGVTLYKADLQQGQRSLQVAVKQFNISGASAAAERQFEKEVHIAQVASASCQRACRMLGCCKLDGNTCLVMSLYLSSAANRIEVLQGKAPLYHLKAKPAVMSGASQVELQEDVGTVKADIQQAKQDLRAAEATGDEKAVAFQRKQLEQLREKELILLRAQTAGPSDAWQGGQQELTHSGGAFVSACSGSLGCRQGSSLQACYQQRCKLFCLEPLPRREPRLLAGTHAGSYTIRGWYGCHCGDS
ncbi:hypothetical protein WJX77_005568 [Trebouxia sp. C0004]